MSKVFPCRVKRMFWTLIMVVAIPLHRDYATNLCAFKEVTFRYMNDIAIALLLKILESFQN